MEKGKHECENPKYNTNKQKKINNKNNPEQLLATFYGFQVITFEKMNGIDLSIYIC